MGDLPAWLAQAHQRATNVRDHMRRPSRLGPTPQELRQMPTRPVMPPPRRIEPQRYRDPEIGETPPPFPFVRIPADAPVHPPGRDSPDAFPATDAGGFDWARSAFPRTPNRFPPSLLAQREPMDREPWRQPMGAPQAGGENIPLPPGAPARVGGFAPPSAGYEPDEMAQLNSEWNDAVRRAQTAIAQSPDPTGLRRQSQREIERMRLRQDLEQRLPRLMAYQDFNRNR